MKKSKGNQDIVVNISLSALKLGSQLSTPFSTIHFKISFYYMASSTSGQDESMPAL